MRIPADQACAERRAEGLAPPAVYTVSPDRPFLRALAEAVLAGDLPRAGGAPPDPFSLADMTIILPTRRAARALQEAFLAAGCGKALLLPRIRPLSVAEDDSSLIAAVAHAETDPGGASGIPPAVGPFERRLVLTRLVMRWMEALRRPPPDAADELAPYPAAKRDSPAQAARLALELERLMDRIEEEGARLDNLAGLVPDAYSEHWQQTLDFLAIVTRFWPDHLAERGLVSPVERRNRLLLEEARRLAADPSSPPVIVAGVRASVPATVALMQSVARLPRGAIVLPALDLALDDASWRAIFPKHPEHPQFGLCKLITELGLDRGDVRELPGPGAATPPAPRARLELLSEIMRPASTTDRWHAWLAAADRRAAAEALSRWGVIQAPTAEDEAEAIALILRHTLETPGRTAALVTPDRRLARRVVSRLECWGIRADDSAGRPLAKTVPGTFLNLTIRAIASGFAPLDVMALLEHPLCRLGLAPASARRAARALDIAAFRAPYPGRGLESVKRALERAAGQAAAGARRHPAVRRLRAEDWAAARDLVARLEAAYAPLTALYAASGDHPLQQMAAAHAAAAEALARTSDDDSAGSAPLWQGEAGEAAALFCAGLMDESIPAPAVSARDYADLFAALIASETVRTRVPKHPRLFVWGPLEARLQRTDVVILGSLNEGTWPEAADPGPWLNRPMLAQLGLPAPEERIGRAAHDFASLLGADRVYLTRAKKVDGAPTVPSRWLMRIEALAAGLGLSDTLAPREPWLAWARARDHVEARRPAAPPTPRPPVEARPRAMSVSAVETWITNPYAIFARHILRLEPLPGLAEPPDASLRGVLVHDVLARFAARHPRALPPDPFGALMEIAREVLGEIDEHPRVAALWLPRIARFARWFADTEPARRRAVARVLPEVTGQLVIEAPGGPFTLTARADRIDETERGLVITDYKTGQVPTDSKVRRGQAPQLPLEAAIALAQGFAGPAPGPVTGLRLIRASGGEPPGEERAIEGDPAALAEEARSGLERLVSRFDLRATPYKAVRREGFRYEFDPFAQLARVAEWSGQSDEEAGEP